jgi:hypothetical protein
MPEHWKPILGFETRAAADAVAAVLEMESVPTTIDARHLVAGVDSDFVLSVPLSLVHRARWVLAQSALSENELTRRASCRSRNEQERVEGVALNGGLTRPCSCRTPAPRGRVASAGFTRKAALR